MLLLRQALKRPVPSTCFVKDCPTSVSAAAVAAAATSASFTTTPRPRKKHVQLPPRPSVDDAEIKHTFVKGSGPGGQKINKTNSAAQVTHLATGIVVKSQATRSKSENFKIAKRILAEKVELLEKGGESRAAKVHDRARKKKASAEKKRRRKYRRLAGENGDEGGKEDGENEDGGVDVVDEVDEMDGSEGQGEQETGRGGGGLPRETVTSKDGISSEAEGTQIHKADSTQLHGTDGTPIYKTNI